MAVFDKVRHQSQQQLRSGTAMSAMGHLQKLIAGRNLSTFRLKADISRKLSYFSSRMHYNGHYKSFQLLCVERTLILDCATSAKGQIRASNRRLD
jgi:hypothetical protein